MLLDWSRSLPAHAKTQFHVLRSLTLATLLGMLGSLGCGGKATSRGTEHSCECTYLTDFDDTFHIAIDLCVAEGADLQQAAALCAAENAHNHVDQCVCKQHIDKSNAPLPCDPRPRESCRPK